MIKPTNREYIHYNNQWYDIQPMDVIIKHITEGIKVIDVTEDVTSISEDVTSGNMVTNYN